MKIMLNGGTQTAVYQGNKKAPMQMSFSEMDERIRKFQRDTVIEVATDNTLTKLYPGTYFLVLNSTMNCTQLVYCSANTKEMRSICFGTLDNLSEMIYGNIATGAKLRVVR